METFGEWLRRQRQQRQLTREQLAQRVGCSVALLRKIEDGERRPSAQVAELLAKALDIAPADRATFSRVARGELGVNRVPGRQAPSPDSGSLAAAEPHRAHLPAQPTPLVGRRLEVGEIRDLLGHPDCRLVTLVGPGGMGKTRLAIETASQVQAAFPHGVFFVPFAPVTSTRFIVPVVANAIEFAFFGTGAAEPQAQLFNYLQDKQMLLVLDNLEHLLAEGGAEFWAELLSHAPHLKLLATSREALGLQAEWVYEVPGLPVPLGSNTESSTPGTAVELFLQRARRASGAYTATPAELPAIVRICQLVEGMPLGIELAAAWVRTLTCTEIVAEIERDLDFLNVSGRDRDRPVRHRSLRAVFEHSWRLLMPEEQQVLLRLSIFRGGFRREAAEDIAGATVPLLSALITKSLVRRSGDGRYDLHEQIRQFAADEFGQHPAEHAETQAQHATHTLEWFGRADGPLHSAAQQQTLAELSADVDNLRASWDWAVAQGQFALIDQTLRAFEMLYDTRSWWQEGLEAVDQVIAAIEKTSDPTALAALGHCLAARGLFAFRLGKYAQAAAALERGLEILRPLPRSRALVEAMMFLGTVMESSSNYRRAEALYTEAQTLAAAVGDELMVTWCQTLLIALAGFTQDWVPHDKTYTDLQTVVAHWRRLGDPRFTAMALNSLSVSAMYLGHYAAARAAQEECLALNSAVGDRLGVGYTYRGLGLIAQMENEPKQAVDLFRRSADIFAELGARSDVARLQSDVGRALLALGNDVEAEQTWRAALRLSSQTGSHFTSLEVLVGLAQVEARRGHLELALAWLILVTGHPATVPDTRDRAQRLRADLEVRTTPAQRAAAEAQAQTLTLEGVTAEILGLASPA